MNKFLGIISIILFAQTSEARITQPGTGTNYSLSSNADIVCFGGRVANGVVQSANEVCIDSNGDIVDTSNGVNINLKSGIANNSSLGTSAFPWGSAYFGTQVFMSGVTPGAAIGTSPFIYQMSNGGFNTSSCGNPQSASPTMVTGTDFAGIITLGTGAPTTNCTLGFNPVYINTPICSVTLNSPVYGNLPYGAGINAVVVPTGIQFGSGLGAPGKISYICVGQTQ